MNQTPAQMLQLIRRAERACAAAARAASAACSVDWGDHAPSAHWMTDDLRNATNAAHGLSVTLRMTAVAKLKGDK